MAITVKKLLQAFYDPVWDMARLLEASAVERDLDPAKAKNDPHAIGGREHTWHFCCTEPMQLMKVWADLYQLRLDVAYGDRQQAAPPKLIENCKAVYDMLENLALLIEPHWAKRYMDYMFLISTHSDATGQTYLVKQTPSKSVKTLCDQGMYIQAVGKYIKAQISQEFHRPSEHDKRAVAESRV